MGFNQKQLEAINTIDGPVMVVSCPGSGKTTVVVNRAKKIVESGIDEAKILVITFTKASADEMRKRYIEKFGSTRINFATIHSVCLTMLKMAYGITNEQIIKGSEQYQIMTEWLQDEDIKDLDIIIPMIYTGISYCNNKDISPENYESEDPVITSPIFTKLYYNYQHYKEKRHLLDFDDILTMTKELLDTKSDWLLYFQSMFQYLMIDEYQDTNKIQADIFYAIAREHKNICVVGDDDQSIYAFRAADSSIMMNFEHEFPDCKKIFMDTNYRSCPEIIAHASALIQNNKNRFHKNFHVGRHDKGNVQYLESEDSVSEIVALLEKAMQNQEDPNDYAVLFRTHGQASLLINQLIAKKIPFQAADKFKDIHDSIFYQDILSFWRLANNKALAFDFQKIINKPNKYFKKQDYAQIKGIHGVNRTEIFKVIDKIDEGWKRRSAREKMHDLVNSLLFMQGAEPKKFFDILKKDIKYMDYIREYCNWASKSEDEMCILFETLEKEALKYYTMQEWFDSVSRQQYTMMNKRKGKDNEKGFVLSTFHSSKGLEWKNVIILDANEGYTPISKAQTDDDIEEERRLFYVAMTRAKDSLIIFSAAHDSKHPVSRFVDESVTPLEVHFAEKEKIKQQDKKEDERKKKRKTKDVEVKMPEQIVQEEETKTAFIIPFGIAKDYTIDTVNKSVLNWYTNNITEQSKYFYVKQQINQYLEKAH